MEHISRRRDWSRRPDTPTVTRLPSTARGSFKRRLIARSCSMSPISTWRIARNVFTIIWNSGNFSGWFLFNYKVPIDGAHFIDFKIFLRHIRSKRQLMQMKVQLSRCLCCSVRWHKFEAKWGIQVERFTALWLQQVRRISAQLLIKVLGIRCGSVFTELAIRLGL